MVGSLLVSMNVTVHPSGCCLLILHRQVEGDSCGRHLQRRRSGISLPLAMRTVHVLVLLVILDVAAGAASKPHVVSMGKPLPVKLFIGAAETKTRDIAVSPLFVDAKLKEFTTGKSHDVTEIGRAHV